MPWRIYYNLKKKYRYEKMKDNLRSENEKSYEIMKLSSKCQWHSLQSNVWNYET